MALPKIVPPDQRGYTEPGLFVTTDWLAAHLDDPGVRILDTDLPDGYDRVHIPGAVKVIDHYYKTSLEDRTHVQGPEQFAMTMSDLGVSDNTTVVGYDSSGALYSLRLAWALHYYGHKNVKVLDGGFPKWFEEGRPLSRKQERPSPGKFTPRMDRSIFASKTDVLAAIKSDSTVLLDARTDGEWTGENKRGTKQGGRVPGAVHMEWVNFHTGGDVPVLKTAAEIRKLAESAGVTLDKEVITYCMGGIRAAHVFWALRLAGYTKVRDYDASWREWGNDLSCPVET